MALFNGRIIYWIWPRTHNLKGIIFHIYVVDDDRWWWGYGSALLPMEGSDSQKNEYRDSYLYLLRQIINILENCMIMCRKYGRVAAYFVLTQFFEAMVGRQTPFEFED